VFRSRRGLPPRPPAGEECDFALFPAVAESGGEEAPRRTPHPAANPSQ
jgi:hypothetical protein